ncbi:MAG: Holliday junction branch migration protein RuvA [Defluviitaleaceae bacterium]|nr:Holliday junction branch migration protein RuvA [Defluviitaleaceae bacterium]
MISYIIGRVAEVADGALVIEAGHMGYFVYVSNATVSRVSAGVDIKLYTSLQIKENDISLIGFLSQEDVRIFNLLTSVSGVGAKVALAIQSVLDSSRVVLAILTEEVDELTRAAGVGKKLASRIVLELKDKLKNSEIGQGIAPQVNMDSGNQDAKQEAADALISLGYSRTEALRAVMETALTDMPVEQIIRQSLKKLAAQ